MPGRDVTRTYLLTRHTAGRYRVAAVRQRHGYTVLGADGRPAVLDVDSTGRPVPVILRRLATALALAQDLAAAE
jgi:hypothetical protein